MFWLKIPVLITPNKAGDLQTSCKKYLLFVGSNTNRNCPEVLLQHVYVTCTNIETQTQILSLQQGWF